MGRKADLDSLIIGFWELNYLSVAACLYVRVIFNQNFNGVPNSDAALLRV